MATRITCSYCERSVATEFVQIRAGRALCVVCNDHILAIREACLLAAAFDESINPAQIYVTRGRSRQVISALDLACWLIHRLTHESYKAIGDFVCRDSSTVRRAIRRVEWRCVVESAWGNHACELADQLACEYCVAAAA